MAASTNGAAGFQRQNVKKSTKITAKNYSLQQGFQILPVLHLLEHLPEVLVSVVICLRLEVGHVVFQPRCFRARLWMIVSAA
jgi:hypothetical protein